MSALGFIAAAFILHTILVVLGSRRPGVAKASACDREDTEAYERLASARAYERSDTEPAGNIAGATYSHNNSEFSVSDDAYFHDDAGGTDCSDDQSGNLSWDDRT